MKIAEIFADTVDFSRILTTASWTEHPKVDAFGIGPAWGCNGIRLHKIIAVAFFIQERFQERQILHGQFGSIPMLILRGRLPVDSRDRGAVPVICTVYLSF